MHAESRFSVASALVMLAAAVASLCATPIPASAQEPGDLVSASRPMPSWPAAVRVPAQPASSEKPLVLRVSDSIGAATGRASIVVRTYAPRPLGQGQLCIVATQDNPTESTVKTRFSSTVNRDGDARRSTVVRRTVRRRAVTTAAGPFDQLNFSRAFSVADDAVATATLEQAADRQILTVQFTSASGTVNGLEGLLAAVDLQLSASVQVGQSFSLQIDPAYTFLFDPEGNPVPIRVREGALSFRENGEPFRVEVEGDAVEPGETALIGFQTFEPFAVASGQVAFRFDPSFVAGEPTVTMDNRHGNSQFTTYTVPGLVVVTFVSADGSLNDVPGEIVHLALPTVTTAPVGTSTPVSLDPGLTFLVDPEGNVLPIEIRPDEIEFR